MAKKNAQADRAQAKAAKQKKLAIVLSAVLVLVLAFEVPKTLKQMHPKAKAPVITADASAPATSTPTTGASTPAASAASIPPVPTSTPSSSPSLISSVQASATPGQLTEFSEFATKDPFDQSVQKTPGTGASSAQGASSTSKPPATPKTPPAPPPTSAVISLNGELMSVSVGSEFPTAGTVFDQTGSPLFQLDSLTATSAKVSIAGGSYASGAPTLSLTLGKAVTLQNTADGSRYTLLLEPQGTQVPATTTAGSGSGLTSTTPSVPTTTTPATTTPSSGTGG
jgi:hypothetical protein